MADQSVSEQGAAAILYRLVAEGKRSEARLGGLHMTNAVKRLERAGLVSIRKEQHQKGNRTWETHFLQLTATGVGGPGSGVCPPSPGIGVLGTAPRTPESGDDGPRPRRAGGRR
jgi:hypothetical protein